MKWIDIIKSLNINFKRNICLVLIITEVVSNKFDLLKHFLEKFFLKLYKKK